MSRELENRFKNILEGTNALIGETYVNDLVLSAKAVFLELLGEDESNNYHGASYRNALRAELREKIEKL